LVKFDRKIADSGFIHFWLRSPHAQQQIAIQLSRAAQPNLFLNNIEQLVSPLPPTRAEQEAIAGALSDADALIESLEQLVAKKGQVKHGAMQELLTGRKRLPGFTGEWETKRFGEVAQPRMDRVDPRRSGPFEYCVELEHIEQGTGRLLGFTITDESSSLKSIFRPRDVLFGKLRAYLRKYWLADRDGVCSTEVWVLTPRAGLVAHEFLFHLVTVDRFIEAASTAYGTHMPRSDWNVVKNFQVLLPSLPEQQAIAAVLSDMDAEVAAVETRLAKARQVKQGMMQELLTGRIRLV
jgi:type I restriction enzyme S subunit